MKIEFFQKINGIIRFWDSSFCKRSSKIWFISKESSLAHLKCDLTHEKLIYREHEQRQSGRDRVFKEEWKIQFGWNVVYVGEC